MIKSRIEESGGLFRFMKEYDVACVSADEYLPKRNEYDTQTEYERKYIEQLEKHRKLDAKALYILLRSVGTVFKIKGVYRRNKTVVSPEERVFAGINTRKLPDFQEIIMDYACKAKQNGFYYGKAGSFEGQWIYTGIDTAEPDEMDNSHKKWDSDDSITIIDESDDNDFMCIGNSITKEQGHYCKRIMDFIGGSKR